VSIGLAVALSGMTGLALAMLLVPLIVRRRAPASRDAYNLAVYRDQLAEVERDLARGVLAAEPAEAARSEIARRILALKPAEGKIAATGQARGLKARGATPVAAAALAILLLPVAAGMLYWKLGSPSLPDQPFAERAAAGTHINMNEAVARLGAHLKTHPEDLTGWLLLGRSELSLGRYREGAEAYRHAADLSGHRADISGDWGEAQVLAAGGRVTAAARAAFEAGLHDPQTAPRSRYYLALAQLQQGDAKGALEAWRDLAADSPVDAEWLPLVRQRIAQAEKTSGTAPRQPGAAPGDAPGDTSADGAAAKASAGASPDERRTMILAMVGRLAARLADQPDDVAGWARLGRSYMVLGQPDKAREAYAHAVKLKPDDPALKQALAEASTAAAGKAGAAAPSQGGSRQ
jgi:cytochrome c-type biogenesis protein CcmH